MAIRSSALGAVLVLVGLALAPTAVDDPKVTTVLDMVYSQLDDGTELRLDLAAPVAGPGPFPAVLVFYGGAWRSGNKASNRSVLTEFARRGFVAVSPQYRHCPRDRFPAQVHDAKAAVRWLRAHAADYHVRPDRIGAMGYSAGAHLALMLGVTGPNDGLEGPAPADSPDSRVQAVVNYFGPTDLNATDISPTSRWLVREFLGTNAEDNPKLAASASPLTFVDRSDPPILTFHGTSDGVVPVSQAVRLSEAMTRASVPGRTELLSGAGHGWTGPAMTRSMEATYAFFAERLRSDEKGATEPTVPSQ